MHIVLDGYNVLKQIIKTKFATQQQQAWFIQFLSRYAKKRNHSLTVVFDGGPYRWPTVTLKEPIRVIYSGERESADEYIKTLASESNNKNIVVISSDRALVQFLARLDIISVSVRDFYRRAKEHITALPAQIQQKSQTQKAHKIIKYDEPENPELDALMHEANTTLIYKDKDTKIQDNQEKLSLTKQEKKLYTILKKL